MKAYVKVFNRDMKQVALLENAFKVGYEMPFNGLWSATFSLPANDEKNEECLPLRYVEIYDQTERIELFRIMPHGLRKSSDGSTITYQCEHVLATLLDDVLFQYHTVGNLGVYTQDVIRYVLEKQTEKRWDLGMVEFGRQFEYNWENDTLLAALFSIPKPFVEEYMFTWDTTVYPWKLNLVAPPAGEQAYIRYGVNMKGITKDTDPTNVCTRLYGLGYGEGINQLTFSEINGGKPYIDADTQGQYGIISSIFVDRRFEYPETLLSRCQALLAELKHPRVSYTIDAAELYSLTKDPIDRFRTGSQVRVQDRELDIDMVVRVVNVRKDDIFGTPGIVQIELSNRPLDIAGSIAELQSRQRVTDTYAQGATNYDSHDFADNCDQSHPAVLKFFIPAETARINKVSLSYQAEPFRAYSKAIEGGGAANVTSAGGGAAIKITDTIAAESSFENGAIYKNGKVITGNIIVDENGGGVPMIWPVGEDQRYKATNLGGAHSHLVEYSGSHNHGGAAGSHNHGNAQNQDYAPPISSDGSHTHNIPRSGEHTHITDIYHEHNAKYHYHLIDHEHRFNLPNHTHQVQLPDHTHGIQYGIYEGPTPREVTVKVDGKVVLGLGTNVQEVDIIPYLAKDGSGKVTRGTFHTIEIAPNSLGRIVATVNLQLFVQSRGGGNY